MKLITFQKTDVSYQQFVDAMTSHIESNALIKGTYGSLKNEQFQGCHIFRT